MCNGFMPMTKICGTMPNLGSRISMSQMDITGNIR